MAWLRTWNKTSRSRTNRRNTVTVISFSGSFSITSHLRRAVSWCWTVSVSLKRPFSTDSFSRRDSLVRTQSQLVSRKARARSVRYWA